MSSAMEFGTSDRCRVCLQHQNDILPLDNIIAVQNEKVSLSHILVSCCVVEILNDDKKPQTICTQCALDAEITYKFKRTVEKSDLTLQYELDSAMNVYVKKEEIYIDEDMTIDGDHNSDTMVLIKDEFTDCTSISYDDDLNQSKIEPKTSKIENIVCKICQTYFTDGISLERHLENCYIRICGVCSQTFTNTEALNEHTISHEAPRSTYRKVIVKQHKKLESHKCRFCKLNYTFPAELRHHLMTHTIMKQYLCSYCGINFSLSHRSKCERTHTRHSHRHISKKPHKCSQCSKAFAYRSGLREHASTHTGDKQYECSHCNKRFTRVSVLNRHNRIHTGEKPYECSHCSKRFNQASSLKSHEYTHTHTREKRYACSYCSKCYTQQPALTVHERTHTGEKPYECSHCSKRFNTQGNLSRHERSHTSEKPYACSRCSKCFTQKGTLTVHERTHTGEKPYACSHCSRRFDTNGHLNEHLRIHTGEKPYECPDCNKRFTVKSHLKRHTLKVHTDEKVSVE